MAAHTHNPEAGGVESGVKMSQNVSPSQVSNSRKPDPKRMEKVRALLARVDALPRSDERSADEIIGYDDYGLPT
jgi:hypothetical protein